jgi:long-chain acyl-CoA synthetase
LKAEDIEVARTVLSVAASRMFASSYSTGPILATHLYDLRPTVLSRTIGSLPVDSIPHLGPPASNIEVMLKGDEVERVEEGQDPVGELFARGPVIVKPVVSSGAGADKWVLVRTRVHSRGRS